MLTGVVARISIVRFLVKAVSMTVSFTVLAVLTTFIALGVARW